jgi:hypothetical protein
LCEKAVRSVVFHAALYRGGHVVLEVLREPSRDREISTF